jgi:hypothetical protein
MLHNHNFQNHNIKYLDRQLVLIVLAINNQMINTEAEKMLQNIP